MRWSTYRDDSQTYSPRRGPGPVCDSNFVPIINLNPHLDTKYKIELKPRPRLELKSERKAGLGLESKGRLELELRAIREKRVKINTRIRTSIEVGVSIERSIEVKLELTVKSEFKSKSRPAIEFASMIENQESRNRLRLTFHVKAPFLATVYNWFNEFECCLTNLTDDLREGRSFTAKTEDNISVERVMIKTDKRVTYQQIRTSFGIGFRGYELGRWNRKKSKSRFILHMKAAITLRQRRACNVRFPSPELFQREMRVNFTRDNQSGRAGCGRVLPRARVHA
ncbi:hypothetical protein EVAR_91587_1 [Eumeta japonica]|uniref:Uncharacterized protein n=1 Tax=Eumeta variegata TaxID=151549 RepID=A0A4C1UXV7_EUMVA|nr:hypothetical protein EVAR_91587_1 [Eumeta japonica]